MKHIIQKASLHPKQLFIIDAFGALVSAFLLGIVLVQLESIFGIPKNTLYLLAAIPVIFTVYDLYCYFSANTFGVHLKVISLLNLSYCALSLTLAFYHHNTLSLLAWIYIIIEVIIVATIAYIEWETSKKVQHKK